jgi:hypothetical protein
MDIYRAAKLVIGRHGEDAPFLVGNHIRLGSGTSRVMFMPDGRRSHAAVDCADQRISLKGTA